MSDQAADSHSIPKSSNSRAMFGLASSPRDAFAMLVVSACIVGTMQVVSWYAPDYVMPSPVKIFREFLQAIIANYASIAVTMLRLTAAIVFCIIVGSLIGVVMGTVSSVRPYLRSLVIINSGIPALSWILIAVFWFKNPEVRIFFILAMIILPFYALNVYDGVRALPKDWLEMFESFRPTRWQSLRMLIIPQVIPYVLMTTKSVIGYATRMVVFAELIGATLGVGAQMGLAQANFRMDIVLAWTFFLILLNIVLQLLLDAVEKAALGWRPSAEPR